MVHVIILFGKLYIHKLSFVELFHFWANFVLLVFVEVQQRQGGKHVDLQFY
jgi:hypothetical protein